MIRIEIEVTSGFAVGYLVVVVTVLYFFLMHRLARLLNLQKVDLL